MGRGVRVSLLAFVLFLTLRSTPASAATKCYLVMLTDLLSVATLLPGVTDNNSNILYFFKEINGIAVLLDDVSLSVLQKNPKVLAVIPDRIYTVYTTHSWGFLGLESGGKPVYKWEQAKFGKGIIIGNVDTGVSPISESFRDDGVLVSPLEWRGKCEAASNKTYGCNNKLIGARVFSEGMKAPNLLPPEEASQLDKTDLNSPWDYVGHGSHTLSTAGGGFVASASFFGHGNGTAKGGSPRARVASYKACYAPRGRCSSMDILAAMLTAVVDGVHVLSLSIGAPPMDYVQDPIAIGALFAVQKGVIVVCAGGNSGPQPGSVSNQAPWIITVAASTMDRDWPAYVTYGNSTIKGRSLADSTLPAGQQHPMIGGDKANAENQTTANSTLCLAGTLDAAKVSGKIVVCTRGVNGRMEKGLAVKEAGGIGMVLCNDASTGDNVVADSHFIPAVHCSYSRCSDLFKYLQSTEAPVGYITGKDSELSVKPAPVVAAFSSRGPNTITPQILKPDITAPGIDVIAAFSKEVSATGLPFDNRRVPFNIMSGTSMSCPHVAGIAGLIKAKYPDWSPAMIKSAIMTTATTEDNDNSQIRDGAGGAATPFSYGSGHVKPVEALDPGLVYDTMPYDYANFLCSLMPTQPLNPTQPLSLLPISIPVPAPLLPLFFFFILFGPNNPFTCSKAYFRLENLNYPSISAACLSVSSTTTVTSRVKNVGAAPWLQYNVTVVQPAAGVKITVVPSTLSFGKINEEKEFTVKLDVVDAAAAANYVFGSFEWTDGTHRVRSPVVATTKCA